MISYKIHLIRTGTTAVGDRKRYVGQSNPPLCDQGRASLEQLRGKYAYPGAEEVYASPLLRCLETARLLYPGQEPQAVENLMDMNLGAFEGKTFEELKGEEAFTRWLANSFENTPPNGEKVEAFTARIQRAFEGIVTGMMERKVQSAAIVTHGGVVMALMALYALPRQPIHQWAANNGCGYTLLTSAQMWMRDRCAEVSSFIPDQGEPDDSPGYHMYDLEK